VLAAVAVVHPLPSALNAVLVAGLALVAGASGPTALVLALAMLGFQASIGTLNDLEDTPRDRAAKPHKPIPAGVISRRTAWAVTGAAGAVGLGISAIFGPAVLALGAAGYTTGLAYDLVMRRWGLGWLCFAVAFPLLLVWTWVAATGELPPAWPVLLPLAALAGPTIHLANSLVDTEADEQAGVRTLATRLGPVRALRVLAALEATVHGLAWLTLALLGEVSLGIVATAALATVSAAVGVALSALPSPQLREAGWLLQAAALALLGIVWVAAVRFA
jgi:4-hydroxybenzoate polyprenyltransferase